ncbi:hypothetical protein HUG17_7442 [Dermatophagoides farinae]|uniref:Uncharacterized protein n=1 Tax=Dermatophagoides farinae TaxID=6954 RepID=A0A9D4SD35_DERFA|nr:hypothetical protein HUG17_7442 [Dermatophagoides farinae]
MTVNDEDESILELFQDYKKFCQNRINDPNSSKENEQLIGLIIETKQNAQIKSMEFHRFMLETATKTIDIGQALSSYELEMKNITQRKLPLFFNLIELIDNQSTRLDSLDEENSQLKRENQLLNDDVEKMNMELVQYKNIVCNLVDDHHHNDVQTTIENSLAITQQQNSTDTTESSSLIKLFIDEKLTEQKSTVDSLVCASIIDELIDMVDNEQQQQQVITNSDDSKYLYNSTTTLSDSTSIADQWFEYSDGSETDFEDAWCNILMDMDNNNNNVHYPYKMNDFRFLSSMMLIMLNEIEHKNTVINEMKTEYCLNRKNFIELHYRFIERGLQMLKFLITLIDLMQQNDDFKTNLPMIQTMANKIENEIKQIVHYEEHTSITI